MDLHTFYPGKKDYDFMRGEVLLIDKPLEWTSFDVVNYIRRYISRHLGVKKIKVGHTGTLDPMATGLLIICTGLYTKKIESLMGMDKGYSGTMKIGATTPSFDIETDIDAYYSTDHIDDKLLTSVSRQFIGKIQQTPPVYSAVKIDGKPAYVYARKNKKVTIKPKDVTIYSFKIISGDLDQLAFEVNCSKGTYIRSLARDFGRALDSGAYLTSLCRTQIGSFELKKAMDIETFRNSLS